MKGQSSWRPDIARLRKQMDDAPDRTVLIDERGDAWQKSSYLNMWYRAYDGEGESAHFLMQNAGKSRFIEIERRTA